MLKDHAGDQGEQLAILYQKAQQCDQLEEEVQQTQQHATRCSKEVEVREGGKRGEARAGFSTSKWLHGTIVRHETPSPHTAIDMLSGKPG